MDGKLYGMPWYAGVRSVIYRTDVFEKAGVKPPTTWDELVKVGDTLKAKEPKMITFPVAGDSEYGVYPFIWGNQGEIAEEDGITWKSDIGSTEAQQGHRLLHRPGHRSTASPARPRPPGTRRTSPTRSPAATWR